MRDVLAIDPGNTDSAFVVFRWEDEEPLPEILCFSKLNNYALLALLPTFAAREMAIEMIASYGMAVGKDVFETCTWIGRFEQRFLDMQEKVRADMEPTRIFRKDVKMHVCGSPKAKDSNIRQALIDRWGGEQAIKKDGALYGVSKDVWAAIGVGLTYMEGGHGG